MEANPNHQPLLTEALTRLSALCVKLEQQDNAATASPYLIGLQEREMIMVPEGYEDETAYVVDEDGGWATFDQAVEKYLEERPHEDLAEAKRVVRSGNHYKEVFLKETWVDKNWFLTWDAYNQHLQANHYHYGRVRSYVHHLNRNQDFNKLIEDLKTIRDELKNIEAHVNAPTT